MCSWTLSHIPGAMGADQPVHRGMVAVDIASFGRRHDPDVQRRLRDGMYDVVRRACAGAGFAFDDCHHEDRGDGILVVAGPEVSVETLVTPMASEVRAGIRRYNKSASEAAQIRMRMAVHAGLVHDDPYGVLGRHVNLLFRILEARELKQLLDARAGAFALIVSNYVFTEIVQYGAGELEAADFTEIPVREKETSEPAWAWVPSRSGSRATEVCPALLALMLARGAAPQDVARFAHTHPELVAQLCGALAGELGLPGTGETAPAPQSPYVRRLLNSLKDPDNGWLFP